MNTSSNPPNRTKYKVLVATLLMGVALAAGMANAHAAITLSTDWEKDPPCPENPKNEKELAEIQNGLRPRPVCPPGEWQKLENISSEVASTRSAAFGYGELKKRDFELERKYKLRIDDKLFYVSPMLFMSKSRPDEVCHPTKFVNTPIYRCDEGQRFTVDCHVSIFNEHFEEVGYHRIAVKEPYQFYCNSVLSAGVGSKAMNEMLVTIQYFPIDRKAASKVSDVGTGWNRMTVALRLHTTDDGKVLIEQDDTCLKNPNHIETVPDARQALRRCAAGH